MIKSKEYVVKYNELIRALENAPEDMQVQLKAIVDQTTETSLEIQDNLEHIRSSMADFRLEMQYVVFDLEARMRELS